MEVLPFNQYSVLIDGSCFLAKRNRKFLRKYTLPFHFSQRPIVTTVDDTSIVSSEVMNATLYAPPAARMQLELEESCIHYFIT